MTVQFVPASKANLRLRMVIIGGSGDGKSTSALRLAAGIAGGGEVLVIDTDNGRANLNADRVAFRTYQLDPPYGGDRYAEAIDAAVSERPAVIVIDTVSEEHQQMLEDQATALDRVVSRMEKEAKRRGKHWSEWECRQKMSMSAWAEAKAPRKRMLARIRSCPCHVILCVRAAVKMNVETKRKEVDMEGFDGFVKEATCSLYLPPNSDGVPMLSPPEKHEMRWATKMDASLRPLFEDGAQLTEEVGARLLPALRGSNEQSVATVSPPEEETAPIDADSNVTAVAMRVDQCRDSAQLKALYNEVWPFLADDEKVHLKPIISARKKELLNAEENLPKMPQ
jgi:hypothetical protein